jgi:hypothetical protein
MTDSIKSILNLSNLPKADLEHIPVEMTYRCKPKRPGPILPFDAWLTRISPLTKNGMKVKIVTDSGLTPLGLVADFNIPNATVGQNAELGHSVYAANTVALDFLKIFLAEWRVPRASLDMLTVADMQAGTVTITYLIPVPNERSTQSILGEIGHRVQQFFPLLKPKSNAQARTKKPRYGGSVVASKDSLTAYLNQRGWSICAYSSPADTIEGENDALVHRERVEFARNTIRIEVTLTAEELRKHQLQPVVAWRTAHADGVYKMLFDEYVRNKALRLDEKLRTDKPRESELLKLSETNQHIVRGYLAGRDLADCIVLKRESKLAAQKAKSAAVRSILKLLRMDINIPWAEHRKLGNTWMEKTIVYVGDHHPPAERVATSFCKANLSAIQAQLEDGLNRTLSHNETGFRVDMETGEVLED